MKIEIKDSDGNLHVQECDDFTYNVDSRDVNCYEKADESTKKLIAGYQNVVYWKVKEPESDPGKKDG